MSKETVRGWEKSKESEYNPLARWAWRRQMRGNIKNGHNLLRSDSRGEGKWQAVARTERKVDVVCDEVWLTPYSLSHPGKNK